MTTKNKFSQFEAPVIGIVHSCFKQKFAVPRQAGLVPAASAYIEMLAPYNVQEAFDGLQGCSHLWLQFIFHQNRYNNSAGWRPKVRPPRMGGNLSMGVFATRSPYRPSALGLSAVKLVKIDFTAGVILHIAGADLVDQTPVVDIKPYIPYADCIPEAVNEFANASPLIMPVIYCAEVLEKLKQCPDGELIEVLIRQVLQQDPRPSYQKTDSTRVYGARISEYDVHWRYIEDKSGEYIEVLDLIDPPAIKPQLP